MEGKVVIIEIVKALVSAIVGGGIGFFVGRKSIVRSKISQNQKGRDNSQMTQVGVVNNG